MPKVRKLSQAEIHELETTPEPPEIADSADDVPVDAGNLDDVFPHLAAWVDERGWIEIGADDYSRSFIRVLDTGGMVWEGKARYPSLGAALRAADTALAELLADSTL